MPPHTSQVLVCDMMFSALSAHISVTLETGIELVSALFTAEDMWAYRG